MNQLHHPDLTAQAQPWFSQNLSFSVATRWERKLKMETQVPERRCSKASPFKHMLCLGIYDGCPPPTSWVKMEISRQSQFLYPTFWWPNVGPLGDLIHLIVLNNFQTQKSLKCLPKTDGIWPTSSMYLAVAINTTKKKNTSGVIGKMMVLLGWYPAV